MKVWITVLKVFGYSWITIGMIGVLIGIIGTPCGSAVQRIMGLFDPLTWLIAVIVIAPGLGAIALAGRLSKKVNASRPNK